MNFTTVGAVLAFTGVLALPAAARREPHLLDREPVRTKKHVVFEVKPFEVTTRTYGGVETLAGEDYGTLIFSTSGSVLAGELKQLLYKTPAYYRWGYTYTAVLTPVSGDPDLYLHERVNGTWTRLKRSWNSGAAIDSFTFTRSEITDTATNVDLDSKGYTAATYNFALYEKLTSAGFLQFPLQYNNWTPYTAPMSAVLDHSLTTGGNCPDYKIVTYTNEIGEDQHGLSWWSTNQLCSSPDRLYGYRNAAGTPFSVNGQYAGTENGVYIFYDGHTGYDYPVPNGTSVYAAANGVAYLDGDGVRVDHPNGYSTYYLHLTTRTITNGQSVTTSSIIGTTGSGHLHLTVKKGIERADPYGWKGPAGQDPLKVGGQDNVCLWVSCP